MAGNKDDDNIIITDVGVKYLKDENGNTISPVVSADSVFDSNGNSISLILGDITTLLDTISGEVI